MNCYVICQRSAISSFRAHTHILIPFEDRELTGLKVDIAKKTKEKSSVSIQTIRVLFVWRNVSSVDGYKNNA